MKTYRLYLYVLLTFAVALGACKKEAAEAPKTDTSSTTTSTTTTTPTPTETTSSGSPFTSEAGKFSISLPSGFSEPTETVQKMPTEAGSVDLKMYTSTSGSTAAMFAYADMSGKIDMKGKEKAMLDGARDNVLKTMNGTLEKEEDMTIDGKPGRQMIMAMEPSGSPKLYGRMQMFMADPIMYEVMYISDDRASLESPSINAYFDSFAIK